MIIDVVFVVIFYCFNEPVLQVIIDGILRSVYPPAYKTANKIKSIGSWCYGLLYHTIV